MGKTWDLAQDVPGKQVAEGRIRKVGLWLSRLARGGLLGTLLAVAGCADRPGPDVLVPLQAEAVGARQHVVLVATTRARDRRPGTFFSGERASGIDYATVKISVPPSHVQGAIEWPKQGAGNPATDFVVQEAIYQDSEKQFLGDLNAQLAKLPVGQRKVLIFVHGYNTMFSEALYRLTQIADDSEIKGVPILFSWASRGKTEDYVYDNNSATAARDSLEQTLMLASASNAEEITILAHSMGNWVTVEALRQMKIAGRGIPPNRVGNVILAAPDIDVDVFKSQLKRFGKPAKPFIVIVSRDDKALGFSDLIAGGKTRLGAYANDAELVELGAVVIDLTNVKAMDGMNHGKFAQIIGMGSKMREALARDAAANGGVVPETISVDGMQISGAERMRQLTTAAGGKTAAAPASQ